MEAKIVSTYTPNKSIQQPANNDFVDVWDVPVNGNMGFIDIALGGSTLLNATGLSGNVALTLAQYRPFALLISGAPSAATNYQVPSPVGGFWSVYNGTTGGKQISVGSAAGGSAINIPVGTSVFITCDGSASGMRVANTPVAVAGGSTTQVQYNSSGILAGLAGFTFDGTTLAVTGLNIGGNTVLGTGAGSTLLLNGTAISAPNGINVNTGALFLTGSQLGVGTVAVGGNTITAAGLIQSLSGGFKFPDGTTQASAAPAGTSPGGASGNVQFNNGSSGFAGQSNFTFNTGTGILTVPALGLTTPLALSMGGTGGTTSTGSGAVVFGTGPSISNAMLTGAPTAPTAGAGTNTTQLATTAFVTAAILPAIALGFQAFTSAGTFTFTPSVTGLHKITVVGGGGGGASGGAGIGDPNGGGGGAGGVATKWASLTTGVGISVTVGAGGGPVSAGSASTGGGATGGGGAAAASTAGGAGGTATGGDLNQPGGRGGDGGVSNGAVSPIFGFGGSNIMGTGDNRYGGGGSGGAPATAGLAGQAGLVLVEW